MKITDIEVITFRVPGGRSRPSKWGYGIWGEEQKESASSIFKIATDEGLEGYMVGGDRRYLEGPIKRMLIGEDPLARETIWNWMDQLVTFGHSLPEHVMGAVDCALWDLLGRMVDLPVHKILGGARDKVKAYASTYPNIGKPEDYAEHALECKNRDTKHTKFTRTSAGILTPGNLPHRCPDFPKKT